MCRPSAWTVPVLRSRNGVDTGAGAGGRASAAAAATFGQPATSRPDPTRAVDAPIRKSRRLTPFPDALPPMCADPPSAQEPTRYRRPADPEGPRSLDGQPHFGREVERRASVGAEGGAHAIGPRR